MAFDLREQLQLTLGEAYRIERELGGGGMSRVFLAVETALGREVVVKVLLPELAVGVSVARFRREIQVAAQLQHPHIVPLLTTGESGGLPYFTMPFVHGESLRARLLRDGELPVPDTIRVLRDVASALAYAHTKGVVHRDIKPDNVLLSHGVAVVTDFGVAKALTVSTGPDGETPGKGITSLGVTLGTPNYMAPEQASADPSMDHRVDIYSFGATAYELLTGQPVFSGRTAQAVLGAHVAVPPTPITSIRPGLPPLLAALIMKCLEKRPADRPQTATEIISSLDTLTTPSGGTVPIAAVHRTAELVGGRGVAAARRLVPMALLLVAAVIALWAWYRRAEAPPPASAIAPVAAPDEPPAPPEPQPVETAPVASVEPPKVERPAPAKPRPKAPAQAPMAADEKALLAQLGTEARAARSRAVTAGADDSLLTRGDSGVARAESLATQGRAAAAASQLSQATELWSDAAKAARAAEQAVVAPLAPPQPVDSVSPPPPRAPPPAPAPPADPGPQIRSLFAEYAAAIESRSVDAIRRSYPGLLPRQALDWQEFFRRVSDMQVELNVTNLKITGDVADAQLEGVYVFTDPGTRRIQREKVSFQASLRRGPGGWHIASVR